MSSFFLFNTLTPVAFIATALRPSRHGVVWVESAFRSTRAMYFSE